MLRKMYLVSPDYLSRNERPATSQQPLLKTAPNTKQKKKKTRGVRVKKKKKGPLHPYDKWVAMRSEIAEAAVGRKALMKAIADFIKAVLPDTTLAQKVTTPKSGSAEEGIQTVRDKTTTAPQFEPFPQLLRVTCMKQRLAPLVLDLHVPFGLLHLPMMMTMMGIQVLLAKMGIQVPLAKMWKVRYANMLESLSDR